MRYDDWIWTIEDKQTGQESHCCFSFFATLKLLILCFLFSLFKTDFGTLAFGCFIWFNDDWNQKEILGNKNRLELLLKSEHK